jgi:hypothetical protein
VENQVEDTICSKNILSLEDLEKCEASSVIMSNISVETAYAAETSGVFYFDAPNAYVTMSKS